MWDWIGSPGGRGYRAPYGANNNDFSNWARPPIPYMKFMNIHTLQA